MKLSGVQLERFLSTPDPAVRVLLVYGPNSGLVHDRAEALAAHLVPDRNDPFSVSRLTGAEAKEDGTRIYDEASALSLGGGRRLVWLRQAVDGNAESLHAFFEKPPACDSVILIEAGDLDKRSKLRALCEGPNPLAAALPCYMEEGGVRLRAIKDALSQAALHPSADAVRVLDATLPQDGRAWRQEIEKLLVYMAGKDRLELEDVQAIVADAGGADLDALVHATASGQVDKTAQLLDALFSEAASPVSLVRALQRHLIRLQLAQAYRKEGRDIQAALKMLRPPVFWKYMEPMSEQLRRWPLERLELRLGQLADAEAALKRTGAPHEALCSQLFLHIAAKG